ncbi:MAG: hypothetical protein P8P99_04000 [Maricaulis sp.]|nr:hypothetical protein [Maricaulis sp.]
MRRPRYTQVHSDIRNPDFETKEQELDYATGSLWKNFQTNLALTGIGAVAIALAVVVWSFAPETWLMPISIGAGVTVFILGPIALLWKLSRK